VVHLRADEAELPAVLLLLVHVLVLVDVLGRDALSALARARAVDQRVVEVHHKQLATECTRVPWQLLRREASNWSVSHGSRDRREEEE
jgi:hypothetical protein